MAAVVMVMLIACANIAGLMLVRAAARGREIAIRGALGASAIRLVRHLVVESMLLSIAGAVLGHLAARWAAEFLVHMLATSRNPLFVDVALDGSVLAFTITMATATGLLVGTLPRGVRYTRPYCSR